MCVEIKINILSQILVTGLVVSSSSVVRPRCDKTGVLGVMCSLLLGTLVVYFELIGQLVIRESLISSCTLY